MDQQVGDAEDGVALVLAHADVDDGAVLLGDDAVDGQRDGDPLVLLDAAVVVGVEREKVVLLLEGVLLEVDARRVDVGAQDVDAGLQVVGAEVDEHEGLAAVDDVDLVAGLELLARCDGLAELDVAALARHLDGGVAALALSLVVGDVGLVALAEVVQLVELLGGVGLPGVLSLHGVPFDG